MISAATSLLGKLSAGIMSASIAEFTIFKAFAVEENISKAPKIIQVNWYPPLCNWTKCNSDGAIGGNPWHAVCGGIFRDNIRTFLVYFSDYIGIASSFDVELVAAMLVIEIAFQRGWHHFWLECDSMLVVVAFHSLEFVP